MIIAFDYLHSPTCHHEVAYIFYLVGATMIHYYLALPWQSGGMKKYSDKNKSSGGNHVQIDWMINMSF